MPINMTDYKMIIHERIYNVLQIMNGGKANGAGNGKRQGY